MTFVVCAAAMPPACAIAHGIGFGLIAYVGIKALAGRVWGIHPAIAIPAFCLCANAP
jgi:adenine/guanine/hypoxanthine permease